MTFGSTNTFKHSDRDGQKKNKSNIIIFGADLSDSKYENNKGQFILILGYGSVKKVNDTEIHAEKSYSPDFTSHNKVTCLSLHYNGDNSYLFVSGEQICKFKAKNSELIKYQMCFGGLSYDYTDHNNKKTGYWIVWKCL